MKFRPFSALVASFLVLAPCLPAADATPAAPAAPPAPAAPAESATEAKVKDLVGRITEKLKAGQRTEKELAAEIGEFATIAGAAKPDEAAMVILMKARLYLEVFQDPAKGVAILKQIATDYPNAPVTPRLAAVIDDIENRMAAQSVLEVGKAFPAIGEADTAGKPLDLSAYAGKVVLVDFWATWCGPCVAELPNVTAAYEKYHAKGFEIIGVSLDKDRQALDDFVKKNKMPWRQYFDGLGWQNKVSSRFGIDSIPATFLIDGQGKIVARDLRGEELDRKLASLLAK
ncbi:MAG TPA: TlpA disulfide reductase family protein [Lacunisphaera sp.]|nr:TlpA disulfide reductase family protein [Lacunisphaera sp.]